MVESKIEDPAGPNNQPAMVAVLNDDPALVHLITLMLETEGLRAIGALLNEVRRGHPDIVDFLSAHDPKVVICDVPPPYDENWAFLKVLADTRTMEGRVLICTTTNREQLLEWAKEATEAIEVVGKPFNPDALLAAVRAGLESLEKRPLLQSE